MLFRLSIVALLLVAVLTAPFLLGPDPDEGGIAGGANERLVIISPHNESIQSEFGQAFSRHMKEQFDRSVAVDWRQPGGTSEIAKFLRSEYEASFEREWTARTDLPFSSTVRGAFQNDDLDEMAAKVSPLPQREPGSGSGHTFASEEEQAAFARRLFLDSSVGVGIDLFFGGGAYDFGKQAEAGNLVARDASGDFGPGALAEQHPDWFSDEVMPAEVSGEPLRDPDFRWVGSVLSAFGICYNEDVLERVGFPGIPKRWDDLGHPSLAGQVALADPTKSGSTTKAFEMLIQEKIQRLVSDGMTEEHAVPQGWDDAMRLLLTISANSRYYTDSAAKVPRDIALGDAAAGMCIDFYGRTFNELFRDGSGASHVGFVMPVGGTSIGADPVGMLRGAPHPELAHRFVEFVLSPEGQKLWNFRPGTMDGPKRFALRRPPIRKDFYTAENKVHQSDPDLDPYADAAGFVYRPEWTGALFAPLRFAIRCACIDSHDEQTAAWHALIEAGLPTDLVAEFTDPGSFSHERILAEVAPILSSKDKVAEVQLARKLAGEFRTRYERIRAAAAAAEGGNP